MARNILQLHHFESYWSEGLSKFNTNFEELSEKVYDFIDNTDLDKVIITQFENIHPEPEHSSIIELCNSKGIEIEFITYGYAWRREETGEYPEEEENISWCLGTRDHHDEDDVVKIEEWQRDFKNHDDKVYLAGAFVGECLADAEAALNALEVNYETVPGLCVGDYKEYEFKGITYDKMQESIYEIVESLDEKINEFFEDIEEPEYTIEQLIELNPEFALSIEEELNESIEPYLEKIFEYSFIPSTEYLEELFEEIINYETESSFIKDQINDSKISKDFKNIIEKKEETQNKPTLKI